MDTEGRLEATLRFSTVRRVGAHTPHFSGASRLYLRSIRASFVSQACLLWDFIL